MKVAIIGQSVFGAEVYKHLLEIGHEVVGVFTIPDVKGKEDPLAATASGNGHPVEVFKYSRWKALKKDGGAILPEVLEQYKKLGAELNVLAFVTQFIPMEISEACKHGSIIYHPSLLPRHRGASAINWTLMEGDEETGLTIFWADDGLDTGPILLQKACKVDPNDTVNSLYKRFLFPEGVKALGEAVTLIATGEAPRRKQPTENASYDPIWKDPEVTQVDFLQPATTIHNFIRGNDRFPGAWAVILGDRVNLFGSNLVSHAQVPEGVNVKVEGRSGKGTAVVANEGLFFKAGDGGFVRVSSIKRRGQIILARELLHDLDQPKV